MSRRVSIEHGFRLGQAVMIEFDGGRGPLAARVIGLDPLVIKHRLEPAGSAGTYGATEDGSSGARVMHLDVFLSEAIIRWREGRDGPACHDRLRDAHDEYKRAVG